MKGKNWATVDAVLGLIGGICGVLGIVTSIKSAKYNEEQMYLGLEERYGLTPYNPDDEVQGD